MKQPPLSVNWRSVAVAGVLAVGMYTFFSLHTHQPGYIIQKADGMNVARYKTDTFRIVTTTVHGTRVGFINQNDGWFDESGDSVYLPEPFRIFKRPKPISFWSE